MSVRPSRCTLTPDSHGGMGNFIAWDATKGEIVGSIPEKFSGRGRVRSRRPATWCSTARSKAIWSRSTPIGDELDRFKTPSGIIGNVMTYMQGDKQYVGILSGVGGWAGIGMAAGLTNPNDGLGAVGGYASLSDYTALGGQLTVFSLPD